MERGTENYVWSKDNRLGEGAFSVVFRGRNRKTNDEVAVKVCTLSKCTTPGERSYIEDIELLQGFNSPYITKYIANEKVQETTKMKRAIVMELADGSLGDQIHLKENRFGLPKESFLILVDNVVKALEYLDVNKLSHRDIKPANILLFRKPTLTFKLSDFGLSQQLSSRNETMHSLVGAPLYMPSSMIRQKNTEVGAKYTKDQYDVWAAACSFFEAATGRRPFLPRQGGNFDVEMTELFKKRPEGTVCAYYDETKQKYVYQETLPKQRIGYTKEFRTTLARYFQLMFSKDKKFLSIEKFSALSRELVGIKEYRYFCLNTSTEESYCHSAHSKYLPQKTLLKSVQQVIKASKTPDNTNLPEEARNILDCFMRTTFDTKLTDVNYREPFLAVLLPSRLFKNRSFGNKVATVYDISDGVRLEIQSDDGVRAVEKKDYTLYQLAEQKAYPPLSKYLGKYAKKSSSVPEDPKPVLTEKVVATPAVAHGLLSALIKRMDAAEISKRSASRTGSQKTSITVLPEDSGPQPDAVDENSESALHAAALKGHAEIVKMLVKSGTNIDATGKKEVTALHCASQEGHMEIVTYLVENGAEVNIPNKNGWTPLVYAVAKEHYDVAEYLLQKGAYVDAVDNDGDTALTIIALRGNLELVRLLIQHGANVNTKDNKGVTALHCAAQEGHIEIAASLLGKRADVNAKSVQLRTPLMQAVANGKNELAELLINCGADVDAADEDGDTALSIAALKGQTDSVKLLLKNGASPGFQDKKGIAPIHCACQEGHLEIVSILHEKGADVNLRNENGWTPLTYAAAKGRTEVAKLLINLGANVNATDTDGVTALQLAAYEGNLAIAKILVQKHASIDATKNNGFTPLLNACQEGHPEVAAYLIEKGANVHARSKTGHTPLMFAAHKGRADMMQLLIKHGADVNDAAEDGETALTAAAFRGHFDIVKLLVLNGANVNAAEHNGITALHCACQQGHAEIASYLLEHHADFHARAKNGSTALIFAGNSKTSDVAKLLISRGADVNASTEEGATALQIAAFEGCLDTVKLLVQNGANIAAEKENGFTPLHNACQEGHPEIAAYLLDRGASINARTKAGYTPLISASINGRSNVVKLLLERGANVNAVDKDGDTALQMAAYKGHEEVVKLLLPSGSAASGRTRNTAAPPRETQSEQSVDAATLLRALGGVYEAIRNRNDSSDDEPFATFEGNEGSHVSRL